MAASVAERRVGMKIRMRWGREIARGLGAGGLSGSEAVCLKRCMFFFFKVLW